MAEAYGWADLAICRSGALDGVRAGRRGAARSAGAISPAVDDHQTLNGGYLVAAGAAVLVPENSSARYGLARVLAGLLSDRGRLLDMARRARGAARPQALAAIERALLKPAACPRSCAHERPHAAHRPDSFRRHRRLRHGRHRRGAA
jgi:UDP-N-acetylglucosamine--N-acetylmuramyl-(pentapeptide) pyrophosphoryl-undecaprenol N-acetylglucosamine transferase